MKKVYLYFICIMSFGIMSAQNPFEKFGYEPKIGTLSKGKYVESFDNDSIVQIGTVMLNVRTKQIVGFVEETITYSEATLEPSISSRWMNPDPLSDQFPEWSPYNFVENNPIRYIDPLGLSPFDVVIEGDVEFRDEAFANLQSLTDSQLAMDKNGKVTIVESGCNSGCDEGQNLVDGLISGDEVVTIVSSNNGNETIPGENGDSTVRFDPNDPTGGIDVSGNKERPTEIGLAHELGHSRDIANGTEPSGESNYVEPYGDLRDGERFQPNSFIYNSYYPLSNGEAKVRTQVENPIRRERGLKPRKMVRKKNFKYDKKY